MLYFYLKFIQLFFPQNILYKINYNVLSPKTYKIEKLSILLIHLMLFFCIYFNDITLITNYILI